MPSELTNAHWVEQWKYPSSDGSRNYTISKNTVGEYACSCPAWTRQRKKSSHPLGHCKHIVDLLIGMKVKPDPPPVETKVPKKTKSKKVDAVKPPTSTPEVKPKPQKNVVNNYLAAFDFD